MSFVRRVGVCSADPTHLTTVTPAAVTQGSSRGELVVILSEPGCHPERSEGSSGRPTEGPLSGR
jgi:hypothetical protein